MQTPAAVYRVPQAPFFIHSRPVWGTGPRRDLRKHAPIADCPPVDIKRVGENGSRERIGKVYRLIIGAPREAVGNTKPLFPKDTGTPRPCFGSALGFGS